MGVHDPVEIKCLEPKVAWGLFQTKVGKITLESHLDIPELARKVSEKCSCLPLALNVIGETMSCKRTVQEWQHAIDVMSSSSGLEDEILPVLKYLNLSSTNLVRLPVAILELKTLIHLNMQYTRRLGSISGISKLSSLRKLGLLHSKVSLDLSLLEELQSLECLEVLTTVIRSSLVMEKMLYAPRVVKCIHNGIIRGLQEESFRVLTLPTFANLSFLMVWSCGMREIKIPTTPCFPNLSSIVIRECDGLKDLTWLLFAQNLTYLEVDSLKQLEAIISEEKATSYVVTEDEEGLVTPFQKLEYLGLKDLPALKSIYWSPLSLPRLNEIFIQKNCLELRKLPLDSKSGVTSEELVIKYKEKEWMERVVWEDEATQLRFLPSCKLVEVIP